MDKMRTTTSHVPQRWRVPSAMALETRAQEWPPLTCMGSVLRRTPGHQLPLLKLLACSPWPYMPSKFSSILRLLPIVGWFTVIPNVNVKSNCIFHSYYVDNTLWRTMRHWSEQTSRFAYLILPHCMHTLSGLFM